MYVVSRITISCNSAKPLLEAHENLADARGCVDTKERFYNVKALSDHQ